MKKAVFSRQQFLGKASSRTLSGLRLGFIGCGGGGSHFGQQFAHVGAGFFVTADPDVIKAHNLNRTVGARWKDVEKKMPKVKIAKRTIMDINPDASVDAHQANWATLRFRLAACDALVGSVDTYQARAELEMFARRHLIPYIDVGMAVTGERDTFMIGGQVISSIPGYPCMRCLGFLTNDKLAREAARYGKAGPRPQVVWSNGTLVSAAVGAVVRWFCPWSGAATPLTYLDYDGNRDTLKPHSRLAYLDQIKCTHYTTLGELGDPFWKP